MRIGVRTFSVQVVRPRWASRSIDLLRAIGELGRYLRTAATAMDCVVAVS